MEKFLLFHLALLNHLLKTTAGAQYWNGEKSMKKRNRIRVER